MIWCQSPGMLPVVGQERALPPVVQLPLSAVLPNAMQNPRLALFPEGVQLTVAALPEGSQSAAPSCGGVSFTTAGRS